MPANCHDATEAMPYEFVMFAFHRLVAAFLTLIYMGAIPLAAAATTDDLFTGTLTVEQGEVILSRCDAAENHYRLIDLRRDKTRPLTSFATPVGGVFDVFGTAKDDGGSTTLTVSELSKRTPRPLCHLADIDAMFAEAAAPKVDPAEKFDLPALLECRSDHETAARFRAWLDSAPVRLATAGLKKRPGRNFIAEYGIDPPIRVFGHPTTTLALHPDGFLAIFGDITPQALADELGAKTMLGGEPFIAQKIIQIPDRSDASPGEIAVKSVSVSSREGLRGQAIAGCLYQSTKYGGL